MSSTLDTSISKGSLKKEKILAPNVTLTSNVRWIVGLGSFPKLYLTPFSLLQLTDS